MSRSTFGFVLISLFCFFGMDRSAAADARPNILFIFADDQSTKTVGCYPESWPWVRTPHIDALAASGVRFTHCYLGSWCMPSRATLLTGHLPHAIESMSMEGVYPGSTYDPEVCPFWPRIFRKHGYQTAQIGKWHTGIDSGYGRDWDFQIVWNRPKYPDNAGAYYGPTQTIEWNGEVREVAGFATDNDTSWACDYIQGQHRDPDKPWYLWLCYGAVHGPATPAPRHKGVYRNAEVPLPADIFPPRAQKPQYLGRSQAWVQGPDGLPYATPSGEAFGDNENRLGRSHAAFVRQVNECALSLDEGVGRVMEALRASGQLENTLVVYAADQGFGMGEHGFRSKLAPYDATFNSPLIISRPGKIPGGAVSRVPVGGPDLVQTFFAQAGIELPWPMHGRDLSNLLRNPAGESSPAPLLFENMGQKYGRQCNTIPADDSIYHGNVPRWVALRYGRHKYIRTLIRGEMEEIYDLEADPEELTNLALHPEQDPLLMQLREMTITELRRTGAGFIEALPATLQMSR